jgi:multiple sugar transport system permease protein
MRATIPKKARKHSPDAGARNNSNRRGYQKMRNRPAYFMLFPLVAYLLVFAAYPLLNLILMSGREIGIRNIVSGDQPWVGFDNFAKVLQDPSIGSAALVTFWFAAGSLVIQVPIAIFFAVIVNARVPGHQVGMAILLLGWALPPVTLGAIVRLMTNTDVGVVNYLLLMTGVIDAPVSWLADPSVVLPTMIFVHSWSHIPFTTLLIYGALKGLPGDIYESAQLDGAGRLRSFFSITLPLLRPVLLIVSLMVVIISFRVFDLIYVLTRGGPNSRTTTLPFHAYREAFARNDFGAGAAISVLTLLALVLIVVAYVFASKREDPEK